MVVADLANCWGQGTKAPNYRLDYRLIDVGKSRLARVPQENEVVERSGCMPLLEHPHTSDSGSACFSG